MKISVIMASHLSEYGLSAKDRVRKFHRAVESFIHQTYINSELIIVSDGCDITIREYKKKYSHDSRIKLLPLSKQPHFSGNVRGAGLFMASGEWVAYLDSDDMLGASHLEIINNGVTSNPTPDWVYFDYKIVWRFNPITNEIMSISTVDSKLELGSIGTSSIAHKKLNEFTWFGCDGYNHDWHFIKKMIFSGKPYAKIDGGDYMVCHIQNSIDN